jgi:hypothetical protein
MGYLGSGIRQSECSEGVQSEGAGCGVDGVQFESQGPGQPRQTGQPGQPSCSSWTRKRGWSSWPQRTSSSTASEL